jgi:hypothetical protein
MADTVVVACKLPHGVHLELGYDPTTGIQDDAKYQRVRINGTLTGLEPGSKATAGEWALTPNVDKAFWDEWLKRNQKLGFVKEGLIFAQPEAKSAGAASRERENLTTKLEPLNPVKDPRVGIRKVEPYNARA